VLNYLFRPQPSENKHTIPIPKFADYFRLSAHTHSMIEPRTKIVPRSRFGGSLARPVLGSATPPQVQKRAKSDFPAPKLVQIALNTFRINTHDSKSSTNFVVFRRFCESKPPFSTRWTANRRSIRQSPTFADKPTTLRHTFAFAV
jgi:hypothetical protein